MGKPRFKPAELFTNPRDFGRNRYAKAQVPAVLDGPRLAWAWYQHQVVLALKDELFRRRWSVEDLATNLGADLAWLRRKLNGQTPADLGEIFSWAILLGVQVLPEIGDLSDLGLE
jgi:hypothetical protein